ncbi:MAG: hypothetical protein A3B38_03350 [Candidatus Levybacteria bacterium RIFCSPLOWO2_01_FULL_36_13]|nr:MAG: hypothetical protein A2684_04295 [Candidatus Levybacteria bacterium RIFCSPHIGHO2_01_FULL_36_15b]OGH34717.1 MAG: hypothetical protein A3B38_03350 [Candidatus Levybacteria bacterium RIFCSPLOWO2_01_FULL_36_13]
MDKILNASKGVKAAQRLKLKKKKVVIVGGIFDILHIGHIRFLQKAKRCGDYLFVLLESDKRARIDKGSSRPINNQKERAEILASINFVDYVITLENTLTNEEYDRLIYKLKPDLIALTKESSTKQHAKRQALRLGAKVLEVIPRIKNKSTTKVADIISKSF